MATCSDAQALRARAGSSVLKAAPPVSVWVLRANRSAMSLRLKWCGPTPEYRSSRRDHVGRVENYATSAHRPAVRDFAVGPSALPLRAISSPPNANGQMCDAVLPRHVLTWAVGQGATHGAGNRMPRLGKIRRDQLEGNGRATDNVALPFLLAAALMGGRRSVDAAVRLTLSPVDDVEGPRDLPVGGHYRLAAVGSPPPRDAGQPLAGGMLPPL